MKKILEILSTIIVVILIIILVFLCYIKYIKKYKLIQIGDYAILIVLSESMSPTIEKEELIIIKKCNEYDLNDIITYEDYSGILITHRILQIDEYSFLSKGDNNNVIDENISIENIKGKVIFHSKFLGFFMLYCMKYCILAVLIILIICLLIGEKRKEKESETNEEEED